MDTLAAETGDRAESPAGWRVVAAAYFGVMVSFGSLLVFSFGTFVKPLSAEFGWSREAISASFGFAAITVAICSPLLGRLLDRFGPRRIILPCMAAFGLGFASLSLLTPHLFHFYAVFVLLGIVGNGSTQMGYSRAVSTWFDRRRGFAFGLVMAGSATGAIVFPPAAQWIITNYGWRSAYALLGATVFIVGMPLTALFVRERQTGARELPESAEGMAVTQALRSSPFWIVIATLFLGSVSVNGAITHLSPLLTDRGFGPEKAALAASILGLAGFLGKVFTGPLLDRFPGPRVAFATYGLAAGGILLLATANALAPAYLAAFLIGLGLGAESDITPYLLTRYFGLRSFSTLYGFSWSAYALAGATGPILMGRAFDASGSYTALLQWLSASTIVAAALNLALPKYR